VTAPTGEDLADVVASGLEALAAAGSLDELAALEPEVLGRRSALATRKSALGGLPPEERRAAGRALNEARQRLEAALADRRRELGAVARRAQLEAERLDLTAVVDRTRPGHLHLVTQAIERL
jgi:phenylalanyl-tRNA synthetase alpha chain